MTAINTATNLVTDTIEVGPAPAVLAITPDSKTVYVPNSDNNTVSVIDTATNRVVATIGVGSQPLAITITSNPQPPHSLAGKKKKDIFATQTDRINVITWSAPSEGISPVRYKIYRDAALTNLAGMVSASNALKFEDHNRKNHTVYSYYIVSEDLNGGLSTAASISIS